MAIITAIYSFSLPPSLSPVLLLPSVVPLSFFFSRSAGVMHTGLACVRLSGCQRVVEPPPCPSYIPSDRCLQSFETYRRLNATPRSPLHGCTQPTDPPLFFPYPFLQSYTHDHHNARPSTKVGKQSLNEHDPPSIPSSSFADYSR